MPEPYRTDWRFAFLGSILVSLLGSGKRQITPKDIHEQMTQYFDSLPHQTHGDKVEEKLKGWLSANRTSAKD